MSKYSSALLRAERWSPFLRGAMARHPDIAAGTSELDPPATGDLRQALRIERDRLALTVALGDLAGELALDEVTVALSDFADRAVDAAIRDVVERVEPGAGTRGFVALALGKLGGRELNYSSDIDPILLVDPDTLPHRRREEPIEAAARMARQLVDLLQTRDASGYVVRVDLRLRPASEVTPLAIPVAAAIGHYESSALAWERAAFVKARAAAGDIALGTSFLETIRPFVWRRSLDFGAVDELRALSLRIRETYADGQAFGPGYDLKRGRGGIREIEFFTQIHQLIHGGRNPALRQRGTRPALAALAEAGVITPETRQQLDDAYVALRTIEHRLQMVDDRQTHSLPHGDELEGVAGLHGMDSATDLLALLQPHVAAVAHHYDLLCGETESRPVAVDLGRLGSRETVRARLDGWRNGRIRALRSAAAIEAFDRAAPRILQAFCDSDDPPAALTAFERLIEGMPSGLNLFRLLDARPRLVDTLTLLLTTAPTLGEALARRPSLLDCLIHARADEIDAEVVQIAGELADSGPLEARLDRIRHGVNERRFALGTRLVEGEADPLAVAAGYSRLAEAALGVAADAVIENFAMAHGRVPGSNFVVLALGRLGGGALTHASDLDLIYLFDGDYRAESDGPRPLGAVHYYNRLAARVSTALSAGTSAGELYEIDTRLRPSGAQGPLVVSLDAFARYLAEDAWTWELMAMTRARPVYGTDDARSAVTKILHETLTRSRERSLLLKDVVKMRGDMARHKPATGPLDVKMAPGSLVDLEFVVHFHQLATGKGLAPNLDRALEALWRNGLVDPALRDANALLTRLLVTLRLVAPDAAVPSAAAQAVVARAVRLPDWAAVETALADARRIVSASWDKIVEEARDDA